MKKIMCIYYPYVPASTDLMKVVAIVERRLNTVAMWENYNPAVRVFEDIEKAYCLAAEIGQLDGILIGHSAKKYPKIQAQLKRLTDVLLNQDEKGELL